MSQIIQNEAGDDVEVFTAEELEAQKTAALEEFKAANPDKSEELTKLQEELDKFKAKDLNFGNLREQKEAAEKKVADLLAGVDEKLAASEKKILEGVLKDHYNETLKGLAGEDPELQKKIELHYNRLADSAATKQEVASKLRDAYFLATKVDDPGALNSLSVSSGNLSRLPTQSSEKKFAPEEKAVGSKFGLTEEDFKKYGG